MSSNPPPNQPSRFADWTADNVTIEWPQPQSKALAARARLWKEAAQPYDVAERKLRPVLLAHWRAQYNTWLATLPHSQTPEEGVAAISMHHDALLGMTLKLALTPLMQEHAARSARQVKARRRKADPEPYDPKAYLDGRAFGRQIQSITDTTRDKVRSVLQRAVDEDWMLDDTEQAMDGVLNDLARAQAIARTEVLGALNDAALEGFDLGGAEWKEWVTSHDPFVRDAHAEADGQVVPIGEPFQLDSPSEGPAELMYPGDPEGPADLIINCRCIPVPSLGPDSEV